MMRKLKSWIAVAAAAVSVGCANGGSVTSPSPLAVATPAVPSSCAVPGAPGDLSATVDGSSVALSWSTVSEAADYVVVVGWTPSSSETLLTNTADAHHALNGVPIGTYYARVHAHNWCGTSAASAAIVFTVG